MIKINKLADKNFEVDIRFTIPLTKEEVKAYTLNSTIAHIIITKIEKEFKRFQKEFKKTGEKIIETIKNPTV